MMGGYWSEGRHWLEGALAAAEAHSPTPARAKVLQAAGYLAEGRGEYARAHSLLKEALTLCRELGDRRGIAFSLYALGRVANAEGDARQAVALLEESLAVCGGVGDSWGLARALDLLGDIARAQGNDQQAREFLDDSLTLSRQEGDKHGIATALRRLADLSLAQGDEEWTTAYLKESLRLVWELGDKLCTARCLEGLASAANLRGRAGQAARLFGAANALRVALGAPLPAAAQVSHERAGSASPGRPDEEAFAAAWAEGIRCQRIAPSPTRSVSYLQRDTSAIAPAFVRRSDPCGIVYVWDPAESLRVQELS
jgi:tetratricopeptide (TPR) repeat protein